jgi:hypothetical protein
MRFPKVVVRGARHAWPQPCVRAAAIVGQWVSFHSTAMQWSRWSWAFVVWVSSR